MLYRIKRTIIEYTKIIRNHIIIFNNSQKDGFQYALFFALNFIFLFNPISRKNVEVQKFTRTFGNGIAGNWDCSRVISNFYFWIILFVILLFGFWIILSTWKQRIKNLEEKNAIEFLDNFMILGCIHLCLKAFLFFRNSQQRLFFSYSDVVINYFAIIGILYFILHLSRLFTFDFYLRIVNIVFALSFSIMTVFNKTEINEFCICIFGLMCIFIIFIRVFKFSEKNVYFSAIIKSSSITICFLPFLTSLYFEFLNILNSHNILIAGINRDYVLVILLLFICTIVLSFVIYKRNLTISFWKRIAFPVIIIGLSALCKQPELSKIYGAHIFESANLSVPVSNFFIFGKIPVITCYPGHMMSGIWQSFIYAFLNGDSFGAILSPYYEWLEFPVLALLFFYFVKTILDENTAFLTSILFPFATMSCWNYFGMGMFLVLAVIIYINKNTLSYAFLVWGAFIWCALYRLDIGFSFFCSTIISILIWCLMYKKKKSAKQLFVSFVITAFSCLLLWIFLCILQNVNPILRLMEFLKLSASNLNWAYNNIGNVRTNLFIFAYLIIPFTISIILILCIFREDLRKSISQSHWIVLLIFGFSYFFNFSRGLVRHSLVENNIIVVFWNAAIFLASSISVLIKKRNCFIPLLTAFVICSLQFVSGSAFSNTPIVENVMQNIKMNLSDSRAIKKERVILEKDMKDLCNSYKFIVDILLEDKETYLDFMNRTFSYSVLKRECPVYVAQSPLMLSGEFTQNMFIKEISENIERVPIALLPTVSENGSDAIDGIMNNYRNYKVAEFIYNNYRPLLKHGDFVVWVLNNRYDDMKRKVLNMSQVYVPMNVFFEGKSLLANNCRVEKKYEDNSINIQFTGGDPHIINLSSFIDTSKYIGAVIQISFKYETDMEGVLQLYYTTEKEEGYSEKKSDSVYISGNGMATFSLPVTEYTRFRLDIPERSNVNISKIILNHDFSLVNHLYQCGHTYNLSSIPMLWAEKDVKNAKNNKVLEMLPYDVGYSLINSYYMIDTKKIEKNQNGNYLLLTIDNQERDESVTIQIGKVKDSFEEEFTSLYSYTFNVLSGKHDYILRISSDFLWYFEDINAINIDKEFKSVDAKILEGD